MEFVLDRLYNADIRGKAQVNLVWSKIFFCEAWNENELLLDALAATSMQKVVEYRNGDSSSIQPLGLTTTTTTTTISQPP